MKTALIYLTSGKDVHMDVSDWEYDEEWEYLEEMELRLLEPRYIRVGNILVATKHVEAVEFVEEGPALADNIPFHSIDGLVVSGKVIDSINRHRRFDEFGNLINI